MSTKSGFSVLNISCYVAVSARNAEPRCHFLRGGKIQIADSYELGIGPQLQECRNVLLPCYQTGTDDGGSDFLQPALPDFMFTKLPESYGYMRAADARFNTLDGVESRRMRFYIFFIHVNELFHPHLERQQLPDLH